MCTCLCVCLFMCVKARGHHSLCFLHSYYPTSLLGHGVLLHLELRFSCASCPISLRESSLCSTGIMEGHAALSSSMEARDLNSALLPMRKHCANGLCQSPDIDFKKIIIHVNLWKRIEQIIRI